MDHVDVDYHIGLGDGPSGRVACVELQRCQDVWQSGETAPRCYAGDRIGIWVRRLPKKAGKSRGAVDRVLAGTGGDLEDEPRSRQPRFERFEDGAAIAGRGGRRLGGGGQIEQRTRHGVPTIGGFGADGLGCTLWEAHKIHDSARAFDTSIWRVVGDPLIRGANSGTLSRLRIAVKDLFAVAGQPIGAGNPAWLAEQVPQPESAPVVASLLAAGADITGIARTDEFAYSLAGTNVHYGSPPNPAVPLGISGGSTSGPASAVALAQADVGLGTDTAGSIRVPASYQGLVGVRTTHGAIDMTSVLPLAHSFDTVGWLARDIATASMVADVLLEGSPDRPLEPKRTIILPCARRWVTPDIADRCDALRGRLSADGALPPPEDGDLHLDMIERWFTAFRTLQAFEAWKAHGAWVTAHPGKLGADVGGRFSAAALVTDADAAEAHDVVIEARSRLRDILEGAVMVLPTGAGGAPARDASAGDIEKDRAATVRLTCLAALAGAPAVSIPALRTGDGRPFGFCVLGYPDTDRSLLRLAAQVADEIEPLPFTS